MSELANFADVARALATAGSTVSAAEAHGCLCGAVCVRRDYGLADWLNEILPDGGATADSELAALLERSTDALANGEMEFEPLLPPDEQPLADRVAALGAWCHGFLYGFGAGGTVGHAALPEDVAEMLGDVAQIANAGAVGSEDEEVEEEAYVELVEFLRAAVQLAYDELAGLRANPSIPNTEH